MAAMEAAEEWVKEPYDLYLHGVPGVGKTMLATICMSARINAGDVGRYLRWTTVVEWMLDEAAGLGQALDETQWFMRKDFLQFMSYGLPLLALDDVGRENASPSKYIDTRFENMVRNRGADLRPTLITTNLEPGQWALRYNPGFANYIERTFRVVEVGPA